MPKIDPRNIEVVDAEQAAALRKLPMDQRIAIMAGANRAARATIAAGARVSHPEWTDEEVQTEVARRMLHGSTRSPSSDRRGA